MDTKNGLSEEDVRFLENVRREVGFDDQVKLIAVLDKLLAERALLVRVAEAAEKAMQANDSYGPIDVTVADLHALRAALAAWRKGAT